MFCRPHCSSIDVHIWVYFNSSDFQPNGFQKQTRWWSYEKEKKVQMSLLRGNENVSRTNDALSNTADYTSWHKYKLGHGLVKAGGWMVDASRFVPSRRSSATECLLRKQRIFGAPLHLRFGPRSRWRKPANLSSFVSHRTTDKMRTKKVWLLSERQLKSGHGAKGPPGGRDLASCDSSSNHWCILMKIREELYWYITIIRSK